MSITIKHLSGPLAGETAFDDSTGTILIGRAPEAQIVYPEECIEVDNEHVKLVRDPTSGAYTIELVGSCDVDFDGKPAETGMEIIPGSVVTVGLSGPRFACFPSGVVIKHVDGPLAGQQKYFPDGIKTIIFGRPPEKTDVSYDKDYTKVGRHHFNLTRNAQGDYRVELTPDHYVEINELEADDGALVKSGDTIRLGGDEGPSFSVTIEKPKKAGVLTEKNKVQTPVRKEVRQTKEKLEETSGKVDTTRWQGGIAAVVLVGLIALVGSIPGYMWLHERQVKDHVLASVYLVVQKNPNGDTAEATAFVIGPGMFATNAHVTEAIRGKVKAFYLLGAKGDRIAITDVESHPGYAAFKAKGRTFAKEGSTSTTNFESEPLPSAYDVGIIRVDPNTPLPEPLELVKGEEALKLKVGDDVMTAGFPSENIRGADNLAKGLAAATFRKGIIESLKEMCFSKSSDDPEFLLLVQHGIPVTGGMSGSPLVDSWTGKVVAIISGGNTRALPSKAQPKVLDASNEPVPTTQDSLQKPKEERITDPSQVNYAQRADLLDELMQGKAYAVLVRDQGYWDNVCGTRTRYFDLASQEFIAGFAAPDESGQKLASGYGVLVPGETNEATAWAPDDADANARAEPPVTESMFRVNRSRRFAAHIYSIEAEPGYIYGFIVDPTDALPWEDPRFAPRLGLRVKTDPLVTDVKPAVGKPELPLAVAVTVTAKTKLEVVVDGLLQKPVRYALYAYRWAMPPTVSTVAPGITPAAQEDPANSTLPQ
jgi:trypsin-like peptidase